MVHIACFEEVHFHIRNQSCCFCEMSFLKAGLYCNSTNYLRSSRSLHISLTYFLHSIISLTTVSLSLWTSRSIPISFTLKASRLPGNTLTNVLNRDHLQKPYATSSTSSYRTTILSLTDNSSYRNMVLPWALEWHPHVLIYLWCPLNLLP